MIPKFRVWDKDEQQMYYQGSNADLDNGIMECSIIFDGFGASVWVRGYGEDDLKRVKNFELDWTVDLLDKNGLDIYKGDVLGYKDIVYTDCSRAEIEEIREEALISIVTYNGLESIVKVHSGKVGSWAWNIEDHECVLIGLHSEELEVIGDVFSNPDLKGGPASEHHEG